LVVGVVLFVLFLIWERVDPDPMLPLHLFRSRNFTVGNLTTFTLYAGLGVATFFIVLFVQQVGGYTPIGAGLALLPITIITFVLARKFGQLADRFGPRVFMSAGPLIAGGGLLLFIRIGAGADYVSQVFPAIAVFGLGLAMTVAPLTAAVLSSVEPGHSGLASGVNNAVARVASLIAIAAIGAIVSSSFQSRLNSQLAGKPLSPQARQSVTVARGRPLITKVPGSPGPDRAIVHAALVNASVDAFRLGMGISAALAILGGLASLVGIENPRREVRCADCSGGALVGASRDLASRLKRVPAVAGASTPGRSLPQRE
jgi:MFS family permease